MKCLGFAAAVALACSGCAIIPEQVEVNYQSDPSVARTSMASSGPVKIDVIDARHAESPAWIADKKNSYGMRLASVVAQRPVSDLIKDALTQELIARGMKLGEGPTTIALEVTRLESIYQNRFFSIGAIGYGDWSVQVRHANGSIAYARTFSVSNDDEAALAGTAGQARRSVETVLTRLTAQLIADPRFISALSNAPVSAERPITPAVATAS